MNTSNIKKYAPVARKQFRDAVMQKLTTLGIEADKKGNLQIAQATDLGDSVRSRWISNWRHAVSVWSSEQISRATTCWWNTLLTPGLTASALFAIWSCMAILIMVSVCCLTRRWKGVLRFWIMCRKWLMLWGWTKRVWWR